MSGKLADSGLITLSKFPILKNDFISFDRGAFSDKIADKGVLWTAIEIKGEVFNVFNTHLNATYATGSPDDLALSLDIRKDQLRQI